MYNQSFSLIESSNEYRYEELNSYSPYLIEYHEETRSFTYTDPWVELENSQNTANDHNHVEVENQTCEVGVGQAKVENETSTEPETNESDETTQHMNGGSYEWQTEIVVENHFEESESKPFDDEVSFHRSTIELMSDE